jgi:hypothetical protein
MAMLESSPEVVKGCVRPLLEAALTDEIVRSPGLPREVDETIALLPGNKRQLKTSGRTNLRILRPQDIPDTVAAFMKIVGGTPWREAGLPSDTRQSALDIRIYYEEAALALADHVPGARSADAWFFQETHAGRLLKKAQRVIRESGGALEDWYFVVPRIHQDGAGG